MEQSLTIKIAPVGFLGTNCYLLADSGECCLIDPGDEAEKLLRAVEASGCRLCCILLTHGHFDHYTAIPAIVEKYPDLPVYIHAGDLSDEGGQLTMRPLPARNQRTYAEGDTVPVGSLSLRVMETPGHSRGSVVLQVENVLFTGDTLFAGSCGRTDFPGSDPRAMRDSLRRLAALEGDFYVFSGHGDPSTLEQERRTNYYLR